VGLAVVQPIASFYLLSPVWHVPVAQHLSQLINVSARWDLSGTQQMEHVLNAEAQQFPTLNLMVELILLVFVMLAIFGT
jgi:hypothetical protein